MARVVAITGVAGRIGSLLAADLEARGYHVVGIDQPSPRSQWSGDQRANFSCDISRVNRVADLAVPAECEGLLEGCDVLLHLAGDGNPQADFLSSLLPNNIAATYNILEEAKRSGVKRVVFASSNHAQMHGFEQPNAAREGFAGCRVQESHISEASDPCLPDSLYGVSKVMGEEMGKFYAIRERTFRFIALRIGWVVYDDPACLHGSPLNEYLRAMWLSKEDLIGYFMGATTTEQVDDYFVGYAVSNNSTRIYNIEETCKIVEYSPVGSSDDFFRKKNDS